ncbi:MAG: helicase, variant 2 [Marteilia pararefringens]
MCLHNYPNVTDIEHEFKSFRYSCYNSFTHLFLASDQPILIFSNCRVGKERILNFIQKNAIIKGLDDVYVISKDSAYSLIDRDTHYPVDWFHDAIKAEDASKFFISFGTNLKLDSNYLLFADYQDLDEGMISEFEIVLYDVDYKSLDYLREARQSIFVNIWEGHVRSDRTADSLVQLVNFIAKDILCAAKGQYVAFIVGENYMKLDIESIISAIKQYNEDNDEPRDTDCMQYIRDKSTLLVRKCILRGRKIIFIDEDDLPDLSTILGRFHLRMIYLLSNPTEKFGVIFKLLTGSLQLIRIISDTYDNSSCHNKFLKHLDIIERTRFNGIFCEAKGDTDEIKSNFLSNCSNHFRQHLCMLTKIVKTLPLRYSELFCYLKILDENLAKVVLPNFSFLKHPTMTAPISTQNPNEFCNLIRAYYSKFCHDNLNKSYNLQDMINWKISIWKISSFSQHNGKNKSEHIQLYYVRYFHQDDVSISMAFTFNEYSISDFREKIYNYQTRENTHRFTIVTCEISRREFAENFGNILKFNSLLKSNILHKSFIIDDLMFIPINDLRRRMFNCSTEETNSNSIPIKPEEKILDLGFIDYFLKFYDDSKFDANPGSEIDINDILVPKYIKSDDKSQILTLYEIYKFGQSSIESDTVSGKPLQDYYRDKYGIKDLNDNSERCTCKIVSYHPKELVSKNTSFQYSIRCNSNSEKDENIQKSHHQIIFPSLCRKFPIKRDQLYLLLHLPRLIDNWMYNHYIDFIMHPFICAYKIFDDLYLKVRNCPSRFYTIGDSYIKYYISSRLLDARNHSNSVNMYNNWRKKVTSNAFLAAQYILFLCQICPAESLCFFQTIFGIHNLKFQENPGSDLPTNFQEFYVYDECTNPDAIDIHVKNCLSEFLVNRSNPIQGSCDSISVKRIADIFEAHAGMLLIRGNESQAETFMDQVYCVSGGRNFFSELNSTQCEFQFEKSYTDVQIFIDDILKIEKIIGYTFSNKSLLSSALIHPSFGNNSCKKLPNDYEILEFMGDSVLDCMIYKLYIEWDFHEDPANINLSELKYLLIF